MKYEGEEERQFHTILDVQNQIYQTLRSLDSKMAEIVGRQERIVSQVSMISSVPQSGGGSAQQPHQPIVDTIRRDEVTHIITQQNELVKNIRDI